MQSALKQRWSGFVESMSPRTRQWATIGGLAAAAVAVLWAVFAMGSGDTAQRTASSASRTDLKPTNVDLMAPGSQLRPEEVWIGKAGRELDQYKQDREENRRINRERQEQQDALLRRFAELEAKLKGAPSPEPPRPASAPAGTSPLGTAAQPTRFPPDAALSRQAGRD